VIRFACAHTIRSLNHAASALDSLQDASARRHERASLRSRLDMEVEASVARCLRTPP